MLYFVVYREEGKITAARVADEQDRAMHLILPIETRNDWKNLEAAQHVANALNLIEGEQLYIATDAGPHVSPRYDVLKLPKIGDKVSYAFNGDSYPCGEILSISPSLKRITAGERDGVTKVFYRVRQTGCWRNAGTWSLVPGHVYKQNPSF